MYNIDYKTTVWQRAKFKDKKSLDRALISVKKGYIEDIFDEDIGFVENEILHDTKEYIHKEGMSDSPTIEAFVNNDLIWSNG